MAPAASLRSTPLDAESREWLESLRAHGAVRDQAIARLPALLLRAARFEAARRRAALPHVRAGELEDVAQEAAADALMSVIRRIDDFRGASRFTTWAYKFALLEAAVKLRKRAWQGREVPLEPESWGAFAAGGLGPADEVEQRELLEALVAADLRSGWAEQASEQLCRIAFRHRSSKRSSGTPRASSSRRSFRRASCRVL